MARKVLVTGASSAIAQATCRLLAHDGDAMLLVARDAARLEAIAQDLRLRGAGTVATLALDLDDTSRHDQVLDLAERELGGLDTVLLAQGVLGDQRQAQASWEVSECILRTNFLAPASLLARAAERFERRGRGTLVVIGSVAGDRGRRSNYVYGSAKGGLALFLQGLRGRLHPAGVRVVTIKPGFVDSPMTAHLKKGPLFVKPEVVARGIRRALDRGGEVVYLPSFWRAIMLVIRLIPERVFKRLEL
jgi:short-subunit dehydrogenase